MIRAWFFNTQMLTALGCSYGIEEPDRSVQGREARSEARGGQHHGHQSRVESSYPLSWIGDYCTTLMKFNGMQKADNGVCRRHGTEGNLESTGGQACQRPFGWASIDMTRENRASRRLFRLVRNIKTPRHHVSSGIVLSITPRVCQEILSSITCRSRFKGAHLIHDSGSFKVLE